MTKIKFNSLMCIVALTGMILTACSTATPAPTQDTGALYTQAASTVFAQLTAAVTPTQPPTATAVPSDTPAPTDTVEPTATPDIALTSAAEVSPTPTQPSGYFAKYLYTVPDNSEQVPNHKFNVAWGLLNAGTIPWAPGFKLVWVGGEQFPGAISIVITKEVPPGSKYEFDLGTFGSEQMGQHRTIWQLETDRGLPIPGGVVNFTYKAV
ncbi:MAG: NBR1-Ig-like domain-containing protein [Anaerolineaceae bacterium]|nr:NBR1-Ig-like domain-containing protein [Anaerolineaceae bacterium]